REIPRKDTLDHLDAHGVLTARKLPWVAYPVAHEHVPLRDRVPANQAGVVDVRIEDRLGGRRAPRGHVRGVKPAVDRRQRRAGDLVAAEVDEERSDRVACPGEPGVARDETGELEAGPEDVLVRGPLGPVAASTHGRPLERRADYAGAQQPALLPVHLEQVARR